MNLMDFYRTLGLWRVDVNIQFLVVTPFPFFKNCFILKIIDVFFFFLKKKFDKTISLTRDLQSIALFGISLIGETFNLHLRR